MRRALCAVACSLVVVALATGTVAWAGSSQPRAHSAAVPDLTGEWVNQADRSGSPPWQLKTSNNIENLEAHWHGGAGPHEHLIGEFHGTLSPGGSYYEGPFRVSELGNESNGTAKFEIINENQIKIEFPNAKYTFVRVAAAPPSTVTPDSTAPALGKPTDYAAPAPGATASTPLPKAPTSTRDLAGEVSFVDNAGKPVAGPLVAGIEAHAQQAAKLCAIFLLAEFTEVEEGLFVFPFQRCTNAIARVLARNDELLAKRARGAGAKTAIHACRVLVRGVSRHTRPPLVVRCTPTATGLKIDVRPRSSKQTLASVLQGHGSKLIVARSAVTPGPAGLRLRELWHAK